MVELSSLTTEGINPNTVTIDECDTEGILRMINAEDKLVAPAVELEIPEITKAVDAVYAGLKNGGHLFYVGAGTSGRLGVLDASECPPTYGTKSDLVQGYIAGGDMALRHAVEGCEDDPLAGRDLMDRHNVGKNDVVVGITASGSAAFVRGALKRAKELGAVTVGVCNNKETDFNTCCDIFISADCGPEVISGSTRMKSGTAQKLILNMITTATMIKLGKVYGNRMVDVRASNKKLHERAIRMLTDLTGVDRDTALKHLRECDMSVKLAAMVILSGKDVETSERLLNENEGYLKRALKAAADN